MKWVENAYCQDNGNFTGGLYGKNVKGKWVAYYGARELGRFSRVEDAKLAVEKAYGEREAKS
jgi:hypothetical protein